MGKQEWEEDIEEISKCQQSYIATLLGKREVTGKSCSDSLRDSVSLLPLIRIRKERGWKY